MVLSLSLSISLSRPFLDIHIITVSYNFSVAAEKRLSWNKFGRQSMPNAGHRRHKHQETIRHKPQTLITYFVQLETVFQTDLCLPSQRPRPPQLLEDHR